MTLVIVGLLLDWQSYVVNHNFIKKAALEVKKKAPAVLNHYDVPETLPV